MTDIEQKRSALWVPPGVERPVTAGTNLNEWGDPAIGKIVIGQTASGSLFLAGVQSSNRLLDQACGLYVRKLAREGDDAVPHILTMLTTGLDSRKEGVGKHADIQCEGAIIGGAIAFRSGSKLLINGQSSQFHELRETDIRKCLKDSNFEIFLGESVLRH